MKNILILLCCLCFPFSTSLFAFSDAHTLYGGYIYSKIKTNVSHGTQLSYRYEPEQSWGLITSLLKVSSDRKEEFNDPRFTKPSVLQQKSQVTALLIGPTYRFNKFFSTYVQMGPMRLKYDEYKHHPTVTDPVSVRSTNILFQGGIDYNPIQNIAINVGYLYANTTVQMRHIEFSGVSVSLGYRF